MTPATGTGTPIAEQYHCTSANGTNTIRTGSVVYVYVSDTDPVRSERTASGVQRRFGEV